MLLLRWVLVSAFVSLFACQAHAQSPGNCDCDDVYNAMIEKLEANYIGHTLLSAERAATYQSRVDSFQVITQRTEPEQCAATLEEFLRFFGDGHLFIVEYPEFPEAELSAIKVDLQTRRMKPMDITQKLMATPASADLEGTWTDGKSLFGFIRNDGSSWSQEYLGVILRGEDEEKLGEVKIAVDGNGEEYVGVYYSNGYAPRYTTLSTAKNGNLLHIRGGIVWGRVDVTDAASLASLELSDPTLPTVTLLNEDAALLTIPTFLIEKQSFDGVLLENAGLLTSVRHLLIDIRGNSGGNGIYFDLMRLYAEHPAQSETGRALASEDNLEYFKRYAGGGPNDPYSPVVADMVQNMGQLVAGPRFRNIELDPMDSRLEKVVIITDESNMSAAETFILHSKKVSDRVLTIGTHTGGVVDYNNVNMVRLGCNRYGTRLGYPMYTRTPRVPDEGFNGVGIAPDVVVPQTTTDVIAFVLEYLADN